MGRRDSPDDFAIVVPPLQIAASSHQPPKWLRMMSRMQHDQAHPIEYTPLHASRDLIVDSVVCFVPPPGQHIRGVEHLVAEPVFGLVERGYPHDCAALE